MTQDSDAGRAALGEWLRYLGEIGVRELRIAAIPDKSASRATMEPVTANPSPSAAVEQPVPATGRSNVTLVNAIAVGPADRLRQVRADLGECTRCKLHRGRSKIVFGVGNPLAHLMFVGEGPGAEEDLRGEPFVGRAGKKLDDMIGAIGLKRADVYIANVVKCRPPNNRDPDVDEIAACSPFLLEQIAAIRPRVIVTLGAPATRTLLQTSIGITKLRGVWQSFRGIPVMPTFHPAYLLRAYTKENRALVWDDLKAAKARTEEVP